jgi:hypothetical protein
MTACAAALVVLAFPYLITVWSESSLCFASRPHIVSGKEKVARVLDFLVQRGTLSAAERSRIDPGSCCRVDKGGREVSPIGLEIFIVRGVSHYVHVPAALIPRYDRIISNVGEREGLFALNSCGTILTRG